MAQFETFPGEPSVEDATQCEAPIADLAKLSLSDITELNLDEFVDPSLRDAEVVTFRAGSSGS